MLIAFCAYLIVLLLIGVIAYGQRTQTTDDYLISARDHGTWVSALSASASAESGWVMLGLVGATYTVGVSMCWILPAALAGYLFNWLVLGPRLQSFSSQHAASSIADVFDVRFRADPILERNLIRLLTVILTVAFMGFYVAAQFVACGKALQAMFDWPYAAGVGVGTALVVIYTSLGGLRAISWTDVLQALLMMIALLVLPAIVLASSADGPGVFTQLRRTDPALLDVFAGKTTIAAFGFAIGLLGLGLGYPGQPHILRRFMSARDSTVFRWGPWIALVWSQAVFAGAILLGLAARITYPDLADPEQALPIAAVDRLPPIFAGLVLAAVFSAICSTADSQLLETTSSITHDIINRFFHVERLQTALSRGVVVLAGAAAGLVAVTESRVIFSTVLYSWAALAAGLGTTLTLSLLWRKTSALAVLLGLISGPATVVIWRSILQWHTLLSELIPGVLASLGVMIIVTLLSPSQELTATDSNE